MTAIAQLRIATAGSVDDGKSTLIGRLLHDTKSVFEDQLSAVTKASRRYGDGRVNLALLTDGLRAEREQGITIDVAYRYFATPARSFVVADTPGHAQYTRNMVTGASVADVAIVLLDARHGMLEQTRRHTFIASLLGVSSIIVAVNKMDLIEWDEGEFNAVAKEFHAFVDALPNPLPVVLIPISALHGDNVVERSVESPWYDGPTLLELLETFPVGEHDEVGARLSVQWVIRPNTQEHPDYRGYAGRLSGGPLQVGDAITVLPGNRDTTVAGLDRGGVVMQRAVAGEAISVQLADNIDVSRGDVLVRSDAPLVPAVVTDVVVDLCWMTERPLTVGSRWLVKHGGRQARATVTAIVHQFDVTTLEETTTSELGLNDIGRVRLSFTEPIVVDRYVDHHEGGHAIIVDEATNVTAAAAVAVAFERQ
jgi:sulfate adenylyltransferase large subunit